MRKLLSIIPIIVGYFYVLTVLFYYGFNSYFNIPYNYIEFSVKNPIILFFNLSGLIIEIARQISWWQWTIVLVMLLIIAALRYSSTFTQRFIDTLLIVIAISMVFGFYNFGNFIASASTNFYTTPSNCIPGATEELYIAPTFIEGKVIFVPIDKITLQLKNGLLVREASTLTCQLQRSKIGKIKK